MSIKAFHIFFIVMSILTATGVAIWSFSTYNNSPDTATLIIAIATALAGMILSWYCFAVIKKFRSIH